MKALDSPTLFVTSQVSVTNRKSSSQDGKTDVLFASDLALTRPNQAGDGRSGRTADRVSRRRGHRFPGSTLRQRGQGGQGPRVWNILSGPATGTEQTATGSSQRREIQRHRSTSATIRMHQPGPQLFTSLRRGSGAGVRRRYFGMSDRKGGRVHKDLS